MQTSPPPQHTVPPGNEAGEIINFPALKNWILLVMRATRSRKRLVFGTALVLGALAALIASALPKSYRSSCRLLAQRNAVLALQGDNAMDITPTHAAKELISKQENLIGIVKETNLLKEWKAHRPFVLRMKDKLTALISKPPDDKQMTDALADYLLTKMQVFSEDTTLTIQVDWRDPVLAFQLVEAAQRAFLEAKHVQEVSAVAESVSILEGHAAAVSAQINIEVAEMQALMERKRAEGLAKATKPSEAKEQSSATPARPAAPAGPTPAELDALEKQQRRMSELATMIDAKTRMINEFDAARVRRVADLTGKLTEQRATYTEQHPLVAETEQALRAGSEESPQVARLRAELKPLQDEYQELKKASAATPTRRFGASGAPVLEAGGAGLGDVIRIEQSGAQDADPEVAYARSKLQFAISNYQALQEQIRHGRIDLDTAQAAFKYRYTVITPAEIPKGPMSPKVPLIIIAALIGGLFIGVVVAMSKELNAGIIFEPWQIQHATGLPVLVAIQLGQGDRRSKTP